MKLERYTLLGLLFGVLSLCCGCTAGTVEIMKDNNDITRKGKTIYDSCTTHQAIISRAELHCGVTLRDSVERQWSAQFSSLLLGEIFPVTEFVTRAHRLNDTLLRETAEKYLIRYLTDEGRWNEADSIAKIFVKPIPSSSRFMSAEGHQMMITLPSADTIRVRTLIHQVPSVDVVINGRRKRFMIDTGTTEMMIFASCAEECGISSIVADSIQTASASIPSRVGLLREMSIGKLSAKNLPVYVEKDESAFRTLISSLWGNSIDGTIGWRVLRSCAVTFDLRNERLIVAPSQHDSSKEKNFFFLDLPVVRMRSNNGRSLLMFFDNGAEFSSAQPRMLDRCPELETSPSFFIFSGAGGKRREFGRRILQLDIRWKDNIFRFEGMPVIPMDLDVLAAFDGSIGADLLMKGVVRMDYPNRSFEFTPYP